MEKQKRKFIPSVDYTKVIDYDATSDFITDAIEFPESTRWSLNVQDYANLTPGTPTITILHSNDEFGEFVPYDDLAIDVDITLPQDRSIYDDIFPSRFMKVQFKSGSSTGTISLVLSK